MSWHQRGKSGGQRSYPPSLKITYPNDAQVEFTGEPREVEVDNENRWCVDVKLLGGSVPSQKNTVYTLWIGITLGRRLGSLFGDPNVAEPPQLKGKRARIWRGNLWRGHRVYEAEKITSALLQPAAPKVEQPEQGIDSFIDAFKDSFSMLKEVTPEEMERWFTNKFGSEHPLITDIIAELVKRGLAEFDKAVNKIKAIGG